MMPPILFLDIDGVMNTTSSCIQNRSGWVFTRSSVHALRLIVRETKCCIVITSTRRSAELDVLKRHFVKNGMVDVAERIIDVTPRFSASDSDEWREDEIDAWLTAHGVTKKYAILDDKPLDGSLRTRLLLMDSEIGLCDAMQAQVTEMLRR